MPKIITVATILVAVLALAKTEDVATVFPVKGMHCESCVKTLDVGVCKTLKTEVQSCQVKLLDPDKEKGQISIVPLPGQKLDADKVVALVKKNGYTAEAPSTAPVTKKTN